MTPSPAAPQPEAPTLADGLSRATQELVEYARGKHPASDTNATAGEVQELATRIESDAERIRELEAEKVAAREWYAGDCCICHHDAHRQSLCSRCGPRCLQCQLAASRERERAERKRGDELWQQGENLRIALRDLAIQCEPLEAGSWIACCMVCKRPSWRLEVDPENHAPGCLATPDSAASP